MRTASTRLTAEEAREWDVGLCRRPIGNGSVRIVKALYTGEHHEAHQARCNTSSPCAGCQYVHIRAESYTEALKRIQLRLYGDYAGSKLSNYEEDHLIPLELGGSPASARNLWPEAHPSSYTKDGVETSLNHAVCRGRVKLAPAQRAIARNWKTAEHALGLK